jgi:diguanylate cyclase (GGDEF)-like protein
VTISGRYARVVRDLESLTTDLTEREVIQRGVDIAQACTDSRIAYLHFLNEDENSIELGVWSHDTLLACKAVYSRHYPVATAGIWADSVRTRAPCVHNDYAAQSGKRGLPDGHSHLVRHLGLPVLDGGKLRMLVGVGNKATDYDADDIDVLNMVATRVWSVTRQRRVLERYLDLSQRFRHVQEIASVCGFEYDVDEDQFAFDAFFATVFRTQHRTEQPTSLHEFLSFVAIDDHEAVRAALSSARPVARTLRISCERAPGERFPAEVKIAFRPRELGHGEICVGILQDVSAQVVAEDLRRRVDTDPLTGLPNRNRLHAFFGEGRDQRREGAHVAFHYLDLDDFKPVNDTCGHPVGDEVLRVVAQRLRLTVRQDDLVVRLGGDEFAVVQTGIDDSAQAAVLAEKIIAAIAEPILVEGRDIAIGASIGVAVCSSRSCRLTDVSYAADRALYQAKSAGGRRYVVAQNHPA